jgi:hypothetical protein
VTLRGWVLAAAVAALGALLALGTLLWFALRHAAGSIGHSVSTAVPAGSPAHAAAGVFRFPPRIIALFAVLVVLGIGLNILKGRKR